MKPSVALRRLEVAMAETFSLTIANLGVRVRCSPSISIDEGRGMYRDFPHHGKVYLSLDIQLQGEARRSSTLDTGMQFKEGVLHFSAPGYEGKVSEQEGSGKISISSKYPLEEIDYALRVAYALLAFQAGGLMIHAAGIVQNGAAYLFFGPSGAGKTTVSRLSTKGSVLNDDLVILLPKEKGWRVYGTPFWNPTQVTPNASSAPLAGLFRLVQSKRVSLGALSSSEAIAELVANVPVITVDLERSGKLLQRLDEISRTVTVKKLFFRQDGSFWDLILQQAGELG